MISSASPDEVEDEIATASSLSEVEDEREDTPDLYRNSALGMMEPRDEDDFSGESEDEDEEMYEDEYEDEIEYGDEMSADGEDNISDEEEELAEMGNIEGLPGDHEVVEVIMGEDEDDDSMDEDEDSSGEEDEDMEDDIEDLVEEIVDAGDDPIDEDAGWEDTSEDGDEGDEVDYEAEAQDLHEVQIHDMTEDQFGRFENMIRATMAEEFDAEDMRNFDDRFIDDGGEEDEEDDDDEDIEGEDEEFVFDQNFAGDEAPPPNLGWDMVVEQVPVGGHRHRHGHGARSPFTPFLFNSPRDPLGEFRNYFRPRSGQSSNTPDDGVNPLLRRGAGSARDPSPRAGGFPNVVRLGLPGVVGHTHQPGLLMDNPMTFLNDLITSLPGLGRNGEALSFHITHQGPRGEVHELNIPLSSGHRHRDTRSQSRRDHTHQDPNQAVSFSAQSTTERWMEEARMIFGLQHADKTPKLFLNRIMAKLTPAAIQ